MISTHHFKQGYLTMRITCGECGRKDQGEASDYRENLNSFKDEGWLVYHEGGMWKHRCPANNPNATPEQKVTFLEKIEKRKNMYFKFKT